MRSARNKILGMNARSTAFLRANKRRARIAADEKIKTKELLQQSGLAVANRIALIRTRHEARVFNWEQLPDSFVIKPNRGLGGEGILVIYNRLKNGKWLTTNKQQLTKEDLELHVINILDGNYSLSNTPDIAFFEERLSIDPLFKHFATQGMPDIRIVVYNGVPVMAMLRVPTKKSGGKANLAQGGLGVGIDITTGLTTHAITKSFFYEKEIDRHPDTKVQLRGVKLPMWSEILKTAVLAAKAVGLKYAGVDIAVDKKRGPVILELNARPGLSIQIANLEPLRERLDRLKGLKVHSIEHGIAIARELFASHIEQQITSITGRQIVGLIEPVVVIGKTKIPTKIRAKIDTGAESSSIDEKLARTLGFGDAIDTLNNYLKEHSVSTEADHALAELMERELRARNSDIVGVSYINSSHGASLRVCIPLKLTLADFTMTINANVVDRSHLQYPMIIGRKNLSHFLVDITKVRLKKVATTQEKPKI